MIELLDNIKKRLGTWTLRPLNLAGRLILFNSVLQAMPSYFLYSMMATKSILRDLQNIQRKFLWSGSHESHKWDLVKWDIVCIPKLQRGLGLHDPEKAILVARSKHWWRWINMGMGSTFVESFWWKDSCGFGYLFVEFSLCLKGL